jgi:TatD DNase family protein
LKSSFIDIHTHRSLEKNELGLYVLDLDEIRSETFSARSVIGLHPWWLDSLSDEESEALWLQIEKLALDTRVWAIGETGMDRIRGPVERQREFFLRHLNCAPHKPLVLHMVRSSSDLLGLIPVSSARPLILHDVNLNQQEVKAWLDRGAYFSYGAALFRSNARATHEALKLVPLDRLFFETDDGSWNIEEAYRAGHALAGPSIEFAAFVEQIARNFDHLFGPRL